MKKSGRSFICSFILSIVVDSKNSPNRSDKEFLGKNRFHFYITKILSDRINNYSIEYIEIAMSVFFKKTHLTNSHRSSDRIEFINTIYLFIILIMTMTKKCELKVLT